MLNNTNPIETGHFTYHIDCIHKQYLVNQHFVYCDLNSEFITNCSNCPMREPKDVDCEYSSISINTENYFDYGRNN